MPPVRRLGFIAVSFAALSLGACSSYEAQWKAAREATVPNDRYAGAWEGQWISARHKGEGDSLHCILTPASQPGSYDAHFKARWLKVFSSTHTVTLVTKPAKPAGTRTFSGTATLSTTIGGGTYHCEGTLSPTHMEAKYDARYDSGKMILTHAGK